MLISAYLTYVYSAVFQSAIIFLHNAKGGNEFTIEQGKSYLKRCARLYNRDPYLRTTRVVKVLQHYMANHDIYMDEEFSRTNSNSPVSVGHRRKRSEDSTTNTYRMNNYAQQQDTTSESSESVIASTTNPPYEVSANPISNNNISTCLSTGIPAHASNFENMFTSSCSSGFDKNTLTNIYNIQQQQNATIQNQQIVDPLLNFSSKVTPDQYNRPSNATFCNPIDTLPEVEFNDCIEATNGFDSVMQNNNGSISNNIPQQFDISSLSSEIPIWELPSGVTWNEWESFLKSNV